MNIDIKYKESETKMYIYEFEVYDDFTFEYIGCMESCRNNKDDIWGHEWRKKYSKEYEKEKEELYKGLAKKYPYMDEEEFEECYEFKKLYNKYNPVMNKTISGEPYYSGCHFGLNIPDEYKLKISIEEIKKEILKKITRKLKYITDE